jgi:hypothetical protein
MHHAVDALRKNAQQPAAQESHGNRHNTAARLLPNPLSVHKIGCVIKMKLIPRVINARALPVVSLTVDAGPTARAAS